MEVQTHKEGLGKGHTLHLFEWLKSDSLCISSHTLVKSPIYKIMSKRLIKELSCVVTYTVNIILILWCQGKISSRAVADLKLI